MLLKHLWTPDRSIQGQAKSGLKIAGVTKRWKSRGFCFFFLSLCFRLFRGFI